MKGKFNIIYRYTLEGYHGGHTYEHTQDYVANQLGVYYRLSKRIFDMHNKLIAH